MQIKPMPKPLKIFVSALEHSSNIHLSYLIENLKKKKIPYTLCGIFDENLLKEKSDFSPNVFCIMGFFDAIKLIFKFLHTKKELAKIAKDCDIAIVMDSSSFNIPLIKEIKKQKKAPKIIYYILPQIWAWKSYRAKILSKICDELWGILPFEADFYPNFNKPIYVGHPLLDEIPFFLKAQNKTNKIAFLPGSRKAEIKALFPIFRELSKELKNKELLLVIPKKFKDSNLEEIYGDISNFALCFDTYEAFKKAEFAFVCSGTATLESTLIGIPTILTYKAKKMDFFLAKMLVKLQYIGLANLFLQYKKYKSFTKKDKNPPIHPEFLQEKVSVKNLLDSYYNYDFSHFYLQKNTLLEYLKNGSTENCAQKIENFYKNLAK